MPSGVVNVTSFFEMLLTVYNKPDAMCLTFKPSEASSISTETLSNKEFKLNSNSCFNCEIVFLLHINIYHYLINFRTLIFADCNNLMPEVSLYSVS